MLNFEKKVVFITGGARGIGAETAKLFLERGAQVINTDITFKSAPLNDLDISKNLITCKLDVTQAGLVSETVDQVAKIFGKIDILVNSAGILHTKPFLEITEEDLDSIFSINFKGTFFVCQSVLRHMMKSKKGSIVNIASLSGKIGGIMAGADYSASKAAIICLTKSLAKTGAPYSIRANSVAPGGIKTDMVNIYFEKFPNEVKKSLDNHPFKRFGETWEVANTIIFLCSDEASYISGACLDINGGYFMD